MNNLKISVITPSYNPGICLVKAIDSVKEQSYRNYEHIIIDGGSTDGTLELLKKNKSIKWISEPDKGQSDAMTKGFNIASGDIVVYLNADDYFLPGAFESVIKYFEQGHKVVMGNVLVKQQWDGYEWLNNSKTDFKDMIRHWIMNAFCVNPVGYFYLKEVQKNVPFNLENHDTMDLEFLLELSLNYRIKKIDTTLGVFVHSKECKTGQAQSLPAYWQPSNWPYVEKLARKNLSEKEYEIFLIERDFGYQRRRQWIIQSLMNTDLLEELIEKGEIIPLPSTLPDYSGLTEIAYPRIVPKNEFAAKVDSVIVIHQVGKVASTSIWLLLLEILNSDTRFTNVYHTHRLNYDNLNFLIRNFNDSNFFCETSLSQCFNKVKDNLNWKFITIVRDPLAIGLSAMFELLSVDTEYEEIFKDDFDIEKIRENICRRINQYILPYWDVEYKDANIIDIYKQSFPKEKGWDIIKNDNIEILLLKYEKVNDIFSDAMEEFIGIPDLKLPRTNITSEKKDRASSIYNTFKRKISFNKEFVDEVYSHPFVEHFYSSDEIKKMKVIWQEKKEDSHLKSEIETSLKWQGIIYDVGMHNADDTDFYLKKGFKVIAIEANPALVDKAKDKYKCEIEKGQFIILNLGITGEENSEQNITFFFNEYMTHWGSFDKALGWRSIQPWYTEEQDVSGRKSINVNTSTLSKIIKKYGDPYFVKIDIEGYDFIALSSFLNSGITPRYVSVENGGKHFLDIFKNAGYQYFKYVPMHDVQNQKLPSVAKEGLNIEYDFNPGASGAFGEETPGKWLSYDDILKLSKDVEAEANEGHWYDLHARLEVVSMSCDKETNNNSINIINTNYFQPLSISRRSIYELLNNRYCAKDIFTKLRPMIGDELKNYSDLLVYAFIKENIPAGSKILEIGGGFSRVLAAISDEYECWNLDKCEGIGNGPQNLPDSYGYKLVADYIGNFNRELPDKYFDFVFSISVFEHFPFNNEKIYDNILNDISRLSKNCFSLHTIDCVIKSDNFVWKHPIIDYILKKVENCHPILSAEKLESNNDLFFLSRDCYEKY